MNDPELIFGEKVEPPGLVVTQVALLVEPLQAGIVGVQLEGLVEEVRAKGLEGVDDRQELQQAGGGRSARAP